MEIINTNKDIFEVKELDFLYLCSKSSIRKLNALVTNCLLIGYQNNKTIIDNEIIMLAKNEMDLK